MNLHLKRYQKDFEHSYAFGVFTTLELLTARPKDVVKVIISPKGNRNEGVTRISLLCSQNDIPIEISDAVITRLTPKESHLVVGVFHKFRTFLSTDYNHVVLVNPRDMGNLGTIIRTMIGFGFTDLALIRPAADIFDPRTIRASMGSIFRISFEYLETLDDYCIRFSHNLYPLVTKGQTTFDQVHLIPPFALIFGNESQGLPNAVKNMGTSISIPHEKQIDSLNLAVTVGIALYESNKPKQEDKYEG